MCLLLLLGTAREATVDAQRLPPLDGMMTAVSTQMVSPASIAAFSLLLALMMTLYSRYTKLSHVPGPLLASFTDLWRAYHQNKNNFAAFSLALHSRYGPIVRFGLNTVHVSDATAVPVIYTNHGEFQKADTYSSLRVPTELGHSVGSVIDMQDESQNTSLKRGVGSAFTMKAILAYEKDVDSTAIELIQSIKAQPVFDLSQMLQFFQLDFLTKIAFSRSFGHLKEKRDIWSMRDPVRQRILHWTRWQALPTLEYILYQHPLWCRFWKIPASSNWVNEALSQLNERLAATKDLPTFTAPKTDLLQKYVDAGQKYPDISPGTLGLMTTSTIAAGFDSTSLTLTSMLYYLITHPDVLKTLKDELTHIDTSATIPVWESVNKLPYLDAVLKEAMRMHPFLNVALERVVPATGVEICGVHLPPGTIVGASADVVHKDTNVFGHDVDVFRPERWLDASEEQRLAMERGSMGFGSGKRVCLGKHIAVMEVKKVVPALLDAFDMSLVDNRSTLESAGPANFPETIMVRFDQRRQSGAWEKFVT